MSDFDAAQGTPELTFGFRSVYASGGNGGRAMAIERNRTRDGAEVRVNVPFYMHSRLVLPNETWKLVGRRCVRPSWLDGDSIQLWLVRSDRTGRWALVEPWQLSLAPIDEALRRLIADRPPPPAPPPFSYPPPVTFAGVPLPGPRPTS